MLSIKSAVSAFCIVAISTLEIEAAFVETSYIDPNTFRFETEENTAGYYILEESEDLDDFYGIYLDLGANAPIWDVVFDPQVAPQGFYRIRAASIFAPLDTDGDRIDDIYELLRPGILDPLDPTDAYLDPDNNGLTHLQEYLRALFDSDNPPQYYSRELSTFNYGQPKEDALSREYTTFNFGEPSAVIEAVSAEVSIYNGSGPLPYSVMPLVVSRVVSLYNFDLPSAEVEAISKVVSLYNGSGVPTVDYLPLSLSREVSVFNFGAPTAAVEAISREVSINALAPTN